MAILINGNGNQAIYAAQDADLIASICGGVTSIAQVGNEFAYDLLDANTIGVEDGVILTKEGRRIQLDIDNIDEFAIPNGQQGTTSYYIIGYKLVTDAESKQTAQTFVQLMDNGTDTIPEDTFRGGADEVYISLYRVTQDGLNIDTVDLLLPRLSNINEINSDLTDKVSGTITNSETKVGTYDGVNLYRKTYYLSGSYSSSQLLDSGLTTSNCTPISFDGCYYENSDSEFYPFRIFMTNAGIVICRSPQLSANGLYFRIETNTASKIRVIFYYTKINV